MSTHYLKSWPRLFEAVATGIKTHELRRCDDRHFEVGDILLLQEFDPELSIYSGRECRVVVTYITDQGRPCALSGEALAATHCILSVRKI